ncbi:MAG: leucine-rich repeat domain-containing protein [Kiritimatiellia bacterium]|jgi:hypothetical protein
MNTTIASPLPCPSRSARLRAFALAHIVLLLPLALSADYEKPYEYSVGNGEAIITGVDKPAMTGAVVIPETLGGYPVRGIAFNAFVHCDSLTAVTLPNSLRNIGEGAFLLCSSLAAVTIPNGVTNIHDGAFVFCESLADITIPASVISIGERVFYSCFSLTNITVAAGNPSFVDIDGVLCDINGTTLLQCPGGRSGAYTIPDSITTIGGGAFYSCASLTAVAIHKGVTSITPFNFAAFSACTSLTSIDVAADNPNYASSGGVLFNKTLATLIHYPNGLHGAYTIPDGVTAIGDDAFRYSAFLTSVTIPGSVTSIGEGAFADCPLLASVLFTGNAPTAVGNDVFYDTPDATVYYLPGATGWGDTFAGRPVVPWDAAFSTAVPPQTTASGAFAFGLAGTEGIPVRIEACDDLATRNWTILTNTTLSADGTLDFTDPGAATRPSRFYRIVFP